MSGETGYEVSVWVYRNGNLVDFLELEDEDYGFSMSRLAKWATESEAEKDL